MKILIVGGGLVGSTLAEKLAQTRHDVSLIDGNHARVEELSETLDARERIACLGNFGALLLFNDVSSSCFYCFYDICTNGTSITLHCRPSRNI